MNAFSPIETSLTPTPRTVSVEAAFAWRGRALQVFSEAEHALSEALLTLRGPATGERISLPHLFGERMKKLEKLLDADGDYATEGARSFAALKEFQNFYEDRSFLSHGVAITKVGKNGNWCLEMKIIESKGTDSELDRRTRVFRQSEAERRLEELVLCVRELASALQGLRAKVAKRRGLANPACR